MTAQNLLGPILYHRQDYSCDKADIALLDRSQSNELFVDITIPHNEGLVEARSENRSQVS